MPEPFFQCKERHRLLGVIKLAGYGGSGSVACDRTARILLGYTGLLAQADDRLIDDALPNWRPRYIKSKLTISPVFSSGTA
jgi:hypothetical protein